MSTRMNKLIHEFKVETYLKEAAKYRFNISKMCKVNGFNRGDVYNHIPRSKEEIVKLWKDRFYSEVRVVGYIEEDYLN